MKPSFLEQNGFWFKRVQTDILNQKPPFEPTLGTRPGLSRRMQACSEIEMAGSVYSRRTPSTVLFANSSLTPAEACPSFSGTKNLT